MAPSGPIQVYRRKRLTDPEDGRPLNGLWLPDERIIYIETSLLLKAAWPILCHEKAHAWCDDIGLYFDDDERMELIIQGMANAMMNEIWWELRTKQC